MNSSSCASLRRTGTVIGHVPQGIAVNVSVMEGCPQCAQGRGCGMGVLARRQQQHIVLKPDCPPERYLSRYPIGSPVTFILPQSDVTLMALLVYTLPLLMALLFSGGAAWLGTAEWLSAALFFSILISGIGVLKYLLRGRMERFRPRLVS